jgi:DNA polymerase III alpha subunit
MVAQAAALGWAAVGIADVNSLAGIVRAHVAARDHQIRLVVGARLRPAMALILLFIRVTALVMKLYQCC